MLEDAAPARYDSPALDAVADQCVLALDEFGGIPGVQAAALAREVAVPGPRRNGQARAGAVRAGSLGRGASGRLVCSGSPGGRRGRATCGSRAWA